MLVSLSIPDRLAGGLWGLLVGDALGVPYEFHAPSALPPREQLDMTPPADFQRAHARVPVGTWSDDGAQALALLASLLHCHELDLDDFGRRLLNWQDWGYLAVDGEVFDIGIQTSRALQALRSGTPPALAGPRDEMANGNGSLMRVLPLALWHRGSDLDLIRQAERQSLVTHGHLRAQVCCALYCLWARRLLQEATDPWHEVIATLHQHYGDDSLAWEQLAWHVRPHDPPDGSGSGYVVDCLRSARWAVETGHSYEAVVKNAISLGRDTDTTACVAGGIAGIQYGWQGIPERWRQQLRGRDLFEPLLKQLVQAHHA
ncbi:ADP-ribosylglycohydrolase [Catalinimonas alkaloidigena]|uniref:ADP-ribosylglycohydrolase n=1 Tax=Catalinimonas alkaloidigena TaxID=1075417 RepID=A0A1G9GIU1_9BACT|nr:ADP-ribosylglycohydrolase family protein [Catalinimonas alkaloidigena]SDL00580.1 ADP-ribosylglycohydrolase [Catalinimonas alkaloidigena]